MYRMETINIGDRIVFSVELLKDFQSLPGERSLPCYVENISTDPDGTKVMWMTNRPPQRTLGTYTERVAFNRVYNADVTGDLCDECGGYYRHEPECPDAHGIAHKR